MRGGAPSESAQRAEHGAPDASTRDEETLTRSFEAYPRLKAWLGHGQRFELTRFAILRLLGCVYSAAFLSLLWQVAPLVGERGLMPASRYVAQALAAHGSRWAALLAEPNLFLLVAPSDLALQGLAALGAGLSIALLCGASHAVIMFTLWVLYRSFIAVGQLWYGYGWELLLVEAGFLAMFLCPLVSLGPFPARRVPVVLIWLYRWLAFRVMLGAGLIKLRGDRCWRDLTCLDFHFETQPLPNPLSPFFHFLSHDVHAGGLLFNHLCELVLPLCIFGPRWLRALAGVGMIAFQVVLILSGNLSFLNWLTIVPLLACFDDRQLARVLPARLCARAQAAAAPTQAHTRTAGTVAIVIAVLSLSPIANMFSRQQRMNAAFDPLMLVNSYGAFGGVGRERRELILEGTRAAEPGPDARWEAYELPFKPGDPARRPGIVSPFQPRLDWQLWFAAMASAEDEPWMLHLIWKLLHADPGVRRLLARDPFGAQPPRYVRVLRYRYRFAPLGSGQTWLRELEGYWLPPLPADDVLRDALRELGYLPAK